MCHCGYFPNRLELLYKKQNRYGVGFVIESIGLHLNLPNIVLCTTCVYYKNNFYFKFDCSVTFNVFKSITQNKLFWLQIIFLTCESLHL